MVYSWKKKFKANEGIYHKTFLKWNAMFNVRLYYNYQGIYPNSQEIWLKKIVHQYCPKRNLYLKFRVVLGQTIAKVIITNKSIREIKIVEHIHMNDIGNIISYFEN